MRARTRVWIRGAGLLLAAFATGCARSDASWEEDLRSPDPHARGLAAIALAMQAAADSPAFLPVLLETIDHPGAGLEQEAAHALVLSGRHHIDALVDALVREPLMSDDRRGAIQNALVSSGPGAAPLLTARLATDARELGPVLGEVLIGLGESSAPPLAELVGDGQADPNLRRFAAFVLLKLGPRAGAARPALEAAATGPDPELAEVARQALRALDSRRSSGRGGPR